MSKQTTKHSQFQIMVDFMAQHKELAQGYTRTVDGRVKSTRLWHILTNELNSDGLPNRSANEWKKVWSDFKVHLKAKMRQNKKNITGTGGGPSRVKPYTALEETVIEVLNLNVNIDGVQDSQRFGCAEPNNALTEENEDAMVQLIDETVEILEENDIELEPTPPAQLMESASRIRNRRNEQSSKNSIIQQQLELQKTFHEKVSETLSKIAENTTEITRYLRKTYDLKKEEINIKKRKIALIEAENIENKKRYQDKMEMQKAVYEKMFTNDYQKTKTKYK